jgi:hypothetical protein
MARIVKQRLIAGVWAGCVVREAARCDVEADSVSGAKDVAGWLQVDVQRVDGAWLEPLGAADALAHVQRSSIRMNVHQPRGEVGLDRC